MIMSREVYVTEAFLEDLQLVLRPTERYTELGDKRPNLVFYTPDGVKLTFTTRPAMIAGFRGR